MVVHTLWVQIPHVFSLFNTICTNLEHKIMFQVSVSVVCSLVSDEAEWSQGTTVQTTHWQQCQALESAPEGNALTESTVQYCIALYDHT